MAFVCCFDSVPENYAAPAAAELGIDEVVDKLAEESEVVRQIRVEHDHQIDRHEEDMCRWALEEHSLGPEWHMDCHTPDHDKREARRSSCQETRLDADQRDIQ